MQQAASASLIVTSTGCTAVPAGGALALVGTTTAPGGVSYLRLLDDTCTTDAKSFVFVWDCIAWQCDQWCGAGWAVHAQTYVADGVCSPARVPGKAPGPNSKFLGNAAVNAQVTFSSNFGGSLQAKWFLPGSTTCDGSSLLWSMGGATGVCPSFLGAGSVTVCAISTFHRARVSAVVAAHSRRRNQHACCTARASASLSRAPPPRLFP